MSDPGQVRQERPYIPIKTRRSDYPLIDNDPHFRRVVGYARASDWVKASLAAGAAPAAMLLMEHFAPSYVGKGGFASIMRLTCATGLTGGFFILYATSIMRFYGCSENQREIDMDMREMVDKVKRGEPLYGVSSLSPYMQGVSARNSRYSGVMLHTIPWFNFTNHNLHGVETAKYYQQAERELAAEDEARARNA